jgi:GEVED domain/Secretion system C-terminal sorting domain
MRKLYVLSLLFLLFSQSGWSQFIQIGTGTASSYLSGPYYRSAATSTFNWSKYAYIYTATELAAIPAGSMITQIEWEKAAGTITAPNNFEILMANNTATALTTATTWGVLTAGATSVYNNTNQGFMGAAPGWESFILTTPFIYTGGTLQIMTDHVKYGTASGANNFYRTAATGMAIGWAAGAAGSAASSLTTTYGNNRPNIKIHYVPGNACTGAVTAGTAVSSVPTVCPSVPYTVSLTGSTLASGITYQWQSATSAAGPFTNIAGATNSSYQATQTVDTWYQCIVTCTASASTQTSSVVGVTTNNFYNCYCTSGATSTTYGDIQRVELNTIDNSSTACNGTYSDYTSISTLLSPGVTYPMELDLYNCTGGTYNYGTRVWIDTDHNGQFDTYELLYDASNSLPATTTINVPFNITIPPTALSGMTRMRIVIIESNATPPACGTYTWGETEDYMVNITPPPTCPQPTLLNVVSTTLNQAVIDWTPGGSETQWQIEYGPQGFTPGTGTFVYTAAHPYTIGSLTPYSFYQARVRAVCTPGDSSYWSPAISWNTYDQGQYIAWDNECPATGFIDISSSPTATYTNIAYLGEIGLTLPFPVLYQGTLVTVATIGNTGGVKFGSTTAQVNYVMEPGNGLYPFIQQLAQSYAVGGGIYYEQVGTSPNSQLVIQWKDIPHWNSPIFPNGATFELIIDEATQEIYYVYDDVILGNATGWDHGADAEIGVRGAQNINVSMNNQAYLQNNSCVHFYYVDCPNPVALTPVYVFPNEAAFTWTASAAGETSWTVVYGPAGFDPLTSGTTLTLTAASVQLLNLIPLGNYDMYIYSECAGGLQSAGLFYNFQTPPICSNPTAFTSAAGVDSLMSSWSWSPYTSFYPSTGFNLQVVAQDSALYTGTVYALDNNFTDTTTNAAWYPGQAVQVYVQAVCGQDTSAYVGPISLIMPISNDNPCGAHPITVGAPGLLYNNTGATVSAEELGIVPPVTGAQTTTGWANDALNHTTWFKFTAPASGNVRIDATGVEYNGQIGVYFGADCSILPSFTLEGANDNEIDGTSEAPNFTVCGLTPGAEYYVMHDGSGTAGNYTIEISEVSVYAGVEGEVLEICYGESTNLFLGIANYTLGGEWIATSPAVVLQGNTFNSTDYASQTYTFNYVVSDGCAVDQASSTVVVYAAPSAGQDGSITVCLNEPFVLWNGLSGNIDANGTWYNASNNAIAAAQDTSGNLAGQFNYDYIVTSPVCPSDTSNVLVVVDGSCDFTASIEENQMGLSMYPNPTSGVLQITKSQIGAASVEVLDLNGKVLQNSAMQQHLLLDLTAYPRGMYMVKVQMNGVSIIERIAVQ